MKVLFRNGPQYPAHGGAKNLRETQCGLPWKGPELEYYDFLQQGQHHRHLSKLEKPCNDVLSFQGSSSASHHPVDDASTINNSAITECSPDVFSDRLRLILHSESTPMKLNLLPNQPNQPNSNRIETLFSERIIMEVESTPKVTDKAQGEGMAISTGSGASAPTGPPTDSEQPTQEPYATVISKNQRQRMNRAAAKEHGNTRKHFVRPSGTSPSIWIID